MAKNHAVFFNINNTYQEYVTCIKQIENLCNTIIDYENMNFSIVEYNTNSIVPNKLEEPLNGIDMGSSYTLVSVDIWKANAEKYLKNAHFHIRIHYDNENINEYLINLHYLTLMLCCFDYLIQTNRLSIFLVPRSGDKFPFGSMDYTDIELYNLSSVHLRTVIGNGKQGIIYGVAKVSTPKEFTIVKSLDFHKISSFLNLFPIINLKKNNIANKDLHEKYFYSSKNISKIKSKKIFSNQETNNLDHYHMLFFDGVINHYLNSIQELRNGVRFGFSNNSNPNLATVDYIFETSALLLKSKFEERKLNFYSFYNNESYKSLMTKIGNTNIFTFAIFAFLFNFSDCNYDDKNQVCIIMDKYLELSIEISDALNQLIQNSLQHSERKVCVISFIKEDKEKKPDNLNILISDLSFKTIIETFSEKMNEEKNIMEKLSELLNLELSDNFNSNRNLLSISNKLELKHFFNDFSDANDEIINLWRTFRQYDLSAHIGLALFSHIMKKCNAVYKVISTNKYCVDEKDCYSNNPINNKNFFSIPGTEYNIIIPIQSLQNKELFSFSQLNYKNYCEDYECYSQFLDFKLVKSKISSESFSSVNDMFLKSQVVLSVNKLNKFSQQLIWTRYWLTIFNSIVDTYLDTKINYIDFNDLTFRKGYLESSSIKREVLIKGFINAIGIYSESHNNYLYFALINLNDMMMKSFKDVAISLSIKKFPENLQLFVAGVHSYNKPDVQLHLVGTTYGEAIQNAYIFSIENGVESFDSKSYISVLNLCTPFFKENRNACKRNVALAPFTMFLKNDNCNCNMFFDNIGAIAEKELTEGEGYKISKTHARLGNKVHTNAFYEMSFLFYRTIMANRVAFEIIQKIRNNSIDIINDNIIFYGYASYSQAILTSLTNILKIYREKHNSTAKVSYAVYQYNLQSESKVSEIQIYMNDTTKCKKSVKVIQIVPISSTLTTFEKMWCKFQTTFDNNQYILAHNHTVIWVRDAINEKKSKNGTKLLCTDIEKEYYYPPQNNKIKTKFKGLNECNIVEYILVTQSFWQKPELCSDCYPNNVLDEKPLMETDPTSTVPAQQIYLNSQTKHTYVDVENLKRISKLKEKVYYGHCERGKNHFQFYINTDDYFAEVESDVREWLIQKSYEKDNNSDMYSYPYQSVIFSPEHNTNVGFSQYVNVYYFNGTAEIISLNEDKEFRSNFICEHAALKNTIDRLFSVFSNFKGYKPVRFYFADDNIITGTTLHKASNLLQSLIPTEYLNLYGTNVFEKCFFLTERLSDSSKKAYVNSKENFISFCHIDVSNTRKQGDSCVGCKLLSSSEHFAQYSATRKSLMYWSKKIIDHKPVPFEKIVSEDVNEPYLMLVVSHILKNLFEMNVHYDGNTYYDMIKNMFLFVCNLETDITSKYIDFFKNYSAILKSELSDNKQQKMLIECLIKIISRPFFTFNQSEKTQAMKFIISISEHILKQTNKSNAESVINKIIDKYSMSLEELLFFLQNHVFKALSNLYSTYLMRKETITAVLCFTENCLDTISKKKLEDFWIHYSVYIQRIVEGSADETKSFWLEHLLISGQENFETTNVKGNKKSFTEVILDEINTMISPETKQLFELFSNELFLSNIRILYESVSQNNQNHNNKSDITDSYLLNRWRQFRLLDFNSLGIKFCGSKQEFQTECMLFEFLNNQENSANEIQENHMLIKERYDSLLQVIKNMIINKYKIKETSVDIAILTGEPSCENKLTFHMLEMISSTIDHDAINTSANAKYTIKKRIINALSDDSSNKLIDYGYCVNVKSHNDYFLTQNLYKQIELDLSDSYFILRFDIDNIVLRANHELKSIVPVYLYVSILEENKNSRNNLPWFIMRDVLTYRSMLNKYLVADFTSDVLQRYAHSVETEAILKTEKEISHSPLKNELIHIEQIFTMTNSNTTKGKMLMWFAARNFCNTMTARLHNRVLRNINKDLHTIINESNQKNTGIKLYVNTSINDGYSIPIKSVADILPIKDTDDQIFNLFKEIITFKGVDNIDLSKKIISTKVGNSFYTYNRDYAKNLIYRICLDALRFSRGAGAECNDFIARIKNHYAFLKIKNIAQEKKGYFNKISAQYKNEEACLIEFSIEETDGARNFDWLVLRNKLSVETDRKKIIDTIKKKLTDPLDFSDGHMSLIAQKEYITKLHDVSQEQYLIENMYSYEDEYFVTRLPIIHKKEELY